MKYLPALCFVLALFSISVFSQIPNPAPAPTTDQKGDSEKTPSVLPQASGDAALAKNTVETPTAETPAAGYLRKDAPAKIPNFETAPVIDGQLNDAIWQHAAVFGDFVQIQPGDNIAPVGPSEVLMGYDSKNLYVAFRIKEDRDKVRATVARRDDIFNDDYVGVYLDTFNDKRQAYCFFFNPLGVQADGTFKEGNGEDYSVDLVMESKGVLTEDGYTIEIAIPFKSLRYEAGKDKQWGIQLFRRTKYNNNELDSWMHISRTDSSTLNQAGHITGLEGIATTRQLELNPSITVSETGRRTAFTFNGDPAGRFVNEGVKGEFGLTAKFSLTPTITLDFAYNPDFAQVEADAPVTTANQRFPIFFPEKRPFFLERFDMFQSSLNLVNTRAIVDPDIAVKITGRRDKNTFGILYASDNAPGNFSKDERQALTDCERSRASDPSVVCANERLVDQNANIGVLRYRRDVGRDSNLGFFATTYNFVDLHNNTAAVDGRFRFDPKTVAEFMVVGTNSRRYFYDPNLDQSLYRTGNGVGYNVYLERADRHLLMNFNANGLSNNYRADVGFTQRTNTNYIGSYIQYRTEQQPKAKIVNYQFWNATNVSYNWKGQTQYFITNTRAQINLQRQTAIGLNHQRGYERDYEYEFGPSRTATHRGAFSGDDPERSAFFNCVQAFIESTPFKQIYINLFMDYTAGGMDYDFGAGPKFPRVSQAALLDPNSGLDPGPGNLLTLDFTVRYQPTAALQTQVNYHRLRMNRWDTGRTAFDDHLVSSRTTYQFTRNTFARLRLDYDSIAMEFRPQFVLGWTPNPGTALYVGYNDDVNYNGFNPFTGRFEPGVHGNGRSFFIKASYLFKKSF
jgi:hypothetical protein